MIDPALHQYVIKLDHTAIAVKRIRDALPLYRDLLGGELFTAFDMPRQGFRWAQLVYPGGSKIELLEPLRDDSFVGRFLARYGEGVHHMTFKVRQIEEFVTLLKARGLRVVDEDYSDPEWKEAFISPRSAHGTIVQVAETILDDAGERRVWGWERLADAILGEDA
jgi:methylmalonyl-CoA/ethylmalonyl-CoA epimerase